MAQSRCMLRVEGFDCPAEIPPLRDALQGVDGIADLGFDPTNGMLAVDYNPEHVTPQMLVSLIKRKSGMQAWVAASITETSRRAWLPRFGLTLGAGIALALGMGIERWGHPRWANPMYLAAVALGGIELLPKAVRSLRRFRLDIHVLMSLALAGAAALGEWGEAATIAFLFGLSESLESLSLDRARRAVRSLLEIAPERAERLMADGSTRDVAAASLRPGDVVRIRAGERVPIDGLVAEGRSSVDQKAITGESIPVVREPGDGVFAGSINGEGSLDVRATRLPGDSLVARIAAQVRQAQAHRAPVERTIERFAAVYTPAVVAMALALVCLPPLAGFGPWRVWFARGLVLLVIACPCALVIATPVAVAAALATAARRGILIKGGRFLEEVGRLRVLAFDKTGTLTRGEPDVVEVVPSEGRADVEVLRIAAALGDRGGHVLGRAIARHARHLALDVPEAHDYRAVPGLGANGRVDATRYHMGSHRYIDEEGLCPADFHARFAHAEGAVGTSVALASQDDPLGWIRLEDRARAEAGAVLADLKRLGIEPVMLTGDNAPTASAMADELGIAERRAGLLPADKARAIAELTARKGATGMVGDGVNDAPALSAARVSVALGGISSATALETADVVLMADDLTALPWLVRHSRRAVAIIHQNIAIAVGSKGVVLILAGCGIANLWMAIAADVGVSLVVVAGALRLLRAKGSA